MKKYEPDRNDRADQDWLKKMTDKNPAAADQARESRKLTAKDLLNIQE